RELIKSQDGASTLFYSDPPYVHSTRQSKDLYKYEMSNKDHQEFLDVVLHSTAKHIISGYSCELYNKALSEWNRLEVELPNQMSSSATKGKETEVLWYNF